MFFSVFIVVEICIQYLMNYLTEEGIIRISGNNNEIIALMKAFDAGQEIDLLKVKDPHVIAGILKSFFRQLPHSLLQPIRENVREVLDLENKQDRNKKAHALLLTLPVLHYKTIKRLFQYIHLVERNSNENKMTTQNLTTVWAPSLKVDSEFIFLLINDYEDIFSDEQDNV